MRNCMERDWITCMIVETRERFYKIDICIDEKLDWIKLRVGRNLIKMGETGEKDREKGREMGETGDS